jgi:hypothetical protein
MTRIFAQALLEYFSILFVSVKLAYSNNKFLP